MPKYYYDFHIHSCLSPCADNDNTPYNIAGMAMLSGIDIVAVTDHNSFANCPAFFKAAKHYGIIPIAGAEITTAEDIHMVCLFPTLECAMQCGKHIETARFKIKNRIDIFGEQLIIGENDAVIGYEENLLLNATEITVDEVKKLTESYNGICFPAHIDRSANSIISVLGTMPESTEFTCVEFNDKEKIGDYADKYFLNDKIILINSDAHRLSDIKDRQNYFELKSSPTDKEAVITELFEYLRGIK